MANIIELRGGNNRKRVRNVRPYPLNFLKEARALVEMMYEVNSGLPLNRIMLAEAFGIAPSSSAYTKYATYIVQLVRNLKYIII